VTSIAPVAARLARRVATATVAVTALAATLGAAPAAHASAQPGDPLAGAPWGIYTGGSDGLWPAYQQATGAQKSLLARAALQARVRRYTGYITTARIATVISSDIASEQRGNPDTLVWMAMFRLWPHTEAASAQPLSSADQTAYKRWIDAAARGIGAAHVAIILEPDLPVALRAWRPAVRLALVRYAVHRLATLPHASVYLDAGSADWLPMKQVISLLENSGVASVRGFALGSSHHVATADEIRYGTAVVAALAHAGYGSKHFVVDTSDNGHAYTNAQFYAKYPHGTTENPPGCTSMTQKVCVSLGIAPTTDVGNAAWGMPVTVRRAALAHCDAFEWAGKPWRSNNDAQFSLAKALNAARTDPYA
jgi:endoglucanase